jgi:hypothetical protein
VNPFVEIETACARLVERAFARIFPSDLEPAQVGRKLVALHESAPSDAYVVLVHPNDYARLEPHRDALEAQWRALLAQLGSQLGDEHMATVVLYADPDVVAGAVAIEAVVDASPPVAPVYFLEFESGVNQGKRLRLGAVATIGRSPENEVVLGDPLVSREHARLLNGESLAIEDLGSLNGTFVNGERVGRATLSANDAIVIGETKLRVSTDG